MSATERKVEMIYGVTVIISLSNSIIELQLISASQLGYSE